jgi:TatD DNase family protein
VTQPPALADTHCHLDLTVFDPDREAVLERAGLVGVRHIMVPALSLESSHNILRLIEAHPCLYAAVGIHPNEMVTVEAAVLRKLRELASHPQVRAVGEIGLDEYWVSTSHDLQVDGLWQQLLLAAELNLPVILHFREKGDSPEGTCSASLLDILSRWVSRLEQQGSPLIGRAGVLHAFSGSLEMAHEVIRLGFYLGVGGSVTYKNARRRQELVAALPLERLLLETDAPFMPPHPHRGGRNEPSYVALIADKIGLLQDCTLEQVAGNTSENARCLFDWD